MVKTIATFFLNKHSNDTFWLTKRGKQKIHEQKKEGKGENKDDGGQTSIEKWQNQFIESRKERKGGSFSFDKKYACRGIKNIQDAKWPQWPSCRENHLETGNDDVSKMHGKQFLQNPWCRTSSACHFPSSGKKMNIKEKKSTCMSPFKFSILRGYLRDIQWV